MNATIYLFGEFNDGYSQYPDDYTSEIFKTFYNKSNSTTQIVIHRDGNLMYYGYIRKLEKGHYIGLCVVINDLLLTQIDGLFFLFENTISELVINGKLIHFNEQGEIVTYVNKLYVNQEEIIQIEESLRNGFNQFRNNLVALPAISYSTSKDSVKEFVVNDDISDIIKSSHTNGYTIIAKARGFNTSQLNSYKGVLVRTSKEKKELQEKLNKVIEEQKNVERKKKYNFNNLLFATIIVWILLFIHLIINPVQRDEVENIRMDLDSVQIINNGLQTILNQKNVELKNFETKLSSASIEFPIIITNLEVANESNDDIETDYGDVIYSSSSMFLSPRITYNALRTGSITLYVKLYTPSGNISKGNSSPSNCSYTYTMTISSGNDNTQRITGWGNEKKGYWSAGKYRFEIWYNNVCLKSKDFFVH